MSASMKISIAAQTLAQALSDVLEETAGEPVGFVLVMSADNIAQYVANVDRADGKELLQSLLDRWKAGRADIPAHYNPDLKNPAEVAGIKWPVMPPSKNQSPILFEDGYAEGWAKCLEVCKGIVAEHMKNQSAGNKQSHKSAP